MKLMMLIDNKHCFCSEDEYAEMFDCLKTILEDHPDTWDSYSGMEDEHDSIINMEIQELIDAKEKKEFCDLAEEYMHCAASFLYAYLTIKKECEK